MKNCADNFFMEKRSADFKTYLREELVLRCKRNPAYSLRSFAKAIGVSPSFLSKVLNGQRRITDQVFKKIVTNLNLDPETLSSFASNEHTDLSLNNLQLEHFKVISDWYHYAILELTKVKGFRQSPDWMALRLGITAYEAKSAIDRLLQLELLELKHGRLTPTSGGNTTTNNEFTDLAFKKMQDALLKKAVESLWQDDLSRRDHTSICMAIAPSLKSSRIEPSLNLRHNLPEALSNMIAFAMNGEGSSFASDVMRLQAIFEQPESCSGLLDEIR